MSLFFRLWNKRGNDARFRAGMGDPCSSSPVHAPRPLPSEIVEESWIDGPVEPRTQARRRGEPRVALVRPCAVTCRTCRFRPEHARGRHNSRTPLPIRPVGPSSSDMEREALECGQCGAALTNDALVAGACAYCRAALKLPRDPTEEKSARLISRAGEGMTVRIDDAAGPRVVHLDGIAWGAPDESESRETQSVNRPRSGFRPNLVVALFLLAVLAIAGVVLAVSFL